MSRSDRVAERIKIEVSDILRREVDDPRIGFITITSVKVSNDLKTARVYFSVLGSEEEKKGAIEGVMSARNFIKIKLCSRLKLRLMPEVYFEFDTVLEKANRLWSLMNSAK
ncbi:MAG: 30S ribosome-binding factor RbfA [Candidatus Margulisiibacteriota bacterium]